MAETLKTSSEINDLARLRARQVARTEAGARVGAVDRRLAALGGLSGGAGLKTKDLIRASAHGVGEQAVEAINARESQENIRQAEIEKQRQFQSNEALLGRQFAGEQAGIGREFAGQQSLLGRQFAGEQAGLQRGFQSGESLLGRQFAGEQAGLQRGFQSSESLLGRQFAGSEAEKGRQFQQGLFDPQQKLREESFQFQKDQFQKEQETTGFNQIISALSLEDPAEATRLLASLEDQFRKSNNPIMQAYGEGLSVYAEAFKNEQTNRKSSAEIAQQFNGINIGNYQGGGYGGGTGGYYGG